MTNKVTTSVARLMRAGDEHSKSMYKLGDSLDALVAYLGPLLPYAFASNLPRGYKLEWWPSNEYELRKFNENGVAIWFLSNGMKERTALLELASDISNGWLDEVSTLLEKDVSVPKEATDIIQAHLASKR